MQIGSGGETEAVQGYRQLKGVKGETEGLTPKRKVKRVAVVQVASDEASKVREGYRIRERHGQRRE